MPTSCWDSNASSYDSLVSCPLTGACICARESQIAGETLNASFGETLGLSTMAAAAFGNMFSVCASPPAMYYTKVGVHSVYTYASCSIRMIALAPYYIG